MVIQRRLDSEAAALRQAWTDAPFPSLKIKSYFNVYARLFASLRNTGCTFVETGVLGGGSLFMWRQWLGPEARIIGIDLNPQARQWEAHGFEIFIGDQGDPAFWETTLGRIGQFDVLLDDGGHQSFQQVVTLNSAILHAKQQCVVVVEDTHASFMSDFAGHGDYSFMNYAQACAQFLTCRSASMFPHRMPVITNEYAAVLLRNVHAVQFFDSVVAFDINPEQAGQPNETVNNGKGALPKDFRYEGRSAADVVWPDPYSTRQVTIRGR